MKENYLFVSVCILSEKRVTAHTKYKIASLRVCCNYEPIKQASNQTNPNQKNPHKKTTNNSMEISIQIS